MRIDELTVRNFAGFEERTFRFHPRFNLLIGDNASGKTAVLDALAVAVGSWFLGLRSSQASIGIATDEVRVVPHANGDGITFEAQYPCRVACAGSVLHQEIRWVRERLQERGRTNTLHAKNIMQLADEAQKKVRAGDHLTLPLVCAYGTERRWLERRGHRRSTGTAQKLPSRFDGYRDCLEFTPQESVLIDWIRDQSTATLHLGRETSALRIVKAAVCSCLEGATAIHYDGRYKDLVVTIEGRGPQFFANLSDGQRVLMTMVGDAAMRMTQLNPHLGEAALDETPGVVLIDELDLHLHPKWQRRIIHDLKRVFPKVQFIATTHSPQLIGEAHPEEIRRLDSQETTVPIRSFGIDSSRVLEELMDTPSRNAEVERLLSRLFAMIDREDFDGARSLLPEVESRLGPGDPEVTRAQTLLSFLASEA